MVFYGIILYSGFAILALYFYMINEYFLSDELEKLFGFSHKNTWLVYLYKEHLLIFFTYYFFYYYKDKKLFEETSDDIGNNDHSIKNQNEVKDIVTVIQNSNENFQKDEKKYKKRKSI